MRNRANGHPLRRLKILRFIDQNCQSDAFLFGCGGQVMDKLAEVCFQNTGVCSAARGARQVEPEVPGSARVVGCLKTERRLQCLDQTPPRGGPREIGEGSVQGLTQRLTQRLPRTRLNLRDKPPAMIRSPPEIREQDGLPDAAQSVEHERLG